MSDNPQSVDPDRRFDGRAEHYHRYRPGYPRAIVRHLERGCGLTRDWCVADVGSGTGKISKLFLDQGCSVYAVEPNGDMRRTAERELADRPRFTSIAGNAESTGLPNRAVNLVVVGQAFHWFDLERSREEFSRILAPSGWLAVIWNERQVEASPFSRAWERLLLTRALDYGDVNHSRFDYSTMKSFFRPVPMRTIIFANRQDLDLEGIHGRLLSCSYAPPRGHPDHEPMLAELERLYEAHNEAGRVTLEYGCRMYYGRLG